MTDQNRKTLITELSDYLVNEFGSPPSGLSSKLAHLGDEYLRDAITICELSQWDLTSARAFPMIFRPENGEYRITVMKRLMLISPEFIAPWMVSYYFGETEGIEKFTVEDVTYDHLIWVAVNILVAGRTYLMMHGVDLSYLREPVDAAHNFVEGNPDRAHSIREIIRSRRVFKVEDIETLMTGGEPLHQGGVVTIMR